MKKTYTENRPWGKFEQFTLNEKTTVKIITIKPKKRLSLQVHKNRAEFWRFLDNPAKVTVGNKTFRVKKDQEVYVPKKTKHRIEAFSKPVRFLEITFGKFEEKDNTRLEDDFGRV